MRQDTATGQQKKWIQMPDIPEPTEQQRAWAEIAAQMNYWQYERECMDYWHIRYTPTRRQYYCFLIYHKFRNLYNIATNGAH